MIRSSAREDGPSGIPSIGERTMGLSNDYTTKQFSVKHFFPNQAARWFNGQIIRGHLIATPIHGCVETRVAAVTVLQTLSPAPSD